MAVDLASLGWDASWAATGPRRGGDLQPGRVSRVDRGICTILGPDGPVRAGLGGGLLVAVARDPVRSPCAGDWVLVRSWPDRRLTVEAVLPRRTAIVWRSAESDSARQVLAANADAVAVLEPLHPAPDLGRVARLLTLARESGATPLVVLTMGDLVDDPVAVAAQVSKAAPGVEVLPVSARRDVGLAPVRRRVAAGRTLALLGRPGAGRSTLVNALAGTTVLVAPAVRGATNRGRQRTTLRQLIPLPGGGAVLDTPEIRAAGADLRESVETETVIRRG